jgi:hypothetical protein
MEHLGSPPAEEIFRSGYLSAVIRLRLARAADQASPRPAEAPALDLAPSWAAWNHAEDGLWPCPEGPDVNLNEVAGPQWINDAGYRARDRLQATESEVVPSYCDRLAEAIPCQ